MKKVLFYAAAIVAMLATAACSNKELTPTPDDQGAVLNIRISSTSAGDTKTGVEYDSELKAHLPYWNTGDQIGVFFDGFGSKTKLDAVLANTSADKASEASFSAENITLNNGTVPGAEGRIYSFYPASAFQANGVVEDDNAVRVNLKGVQNPAAVDTYDPAADILVGQPSDYMYGEGLLVADVAFARAMSIVKVTLKAGSECPDNLAVNSFTMTAPEGTILTGRAKLSLAALYDDASPILDWTIKNNTVAANYNGDFHPVIGGAENTVYVIVNPTTIASGNIVFNIDTDDYTIEKTVTLSKALAFPQSNVANIGLTITGENCTPKVTETRIFVENFDAANPKDGKEQLAPSATGATGTGVTNDLTYTYSTDNTNIRNNSTNGHGNSNPYLWISGTDQYLIISNITVASETALKFTCQTWTTQSTATVTIQYKESSSDTWVDAGTMDASQSTKNTEQNILFTVDEENTSIDIKILGSTGNLVVDDIVLERFVDTRETLAAPANIVASVDAETPNKINISWDAVEHADKYEVVLSASDEEDVVFEPTTNSVAATGLTYEKEYSIKVKAVTTDTRNYKDSDYACAESTVTTGEEPSVTSGWIKTDISDITSTDIVVIVGSGYGIQNDNGTSGAPECIEVTISNDAITSEVPDNIKWNVGGDATDGYIFYVNGDNTKWLYCNTTAATRANDNIRVGTGNRNAWKINNNGYYENTKGGSETYTKRVLSMNGTSDWRSYVNEDNNPQILEFYVYQDARESQTLSYSATTGTIDLYGDIRNLPTLDASGAVTTITYTSSVPAVATVDENTGVITAIAEGETVITATAAADATHKSASDSFTLTVSDSTPKTDLSEPSNLQWNAETKELSWDDTNTDKGTHGTNYKYQYSVGDEDHYADASSATGQTLTITSTQTVYVKAVAITTETHNSSTSVSKECTVASSGDPVGTKYLNIDFSDLTTWSTTGNTSLTTNGVTITCNYARMYGQVGCIKLGYSTATNNVVSLPALSGMKDEKCNVTLTFKAVSSVSDYTMTVTASAGTVGKLSPAAITKHSSSINNGATTASALTAAFAASTASFSVTITDATPSTVITISAGSAKQWFLDDIVVTKTN